jgi:hypothetical protein
LAFDQLDKSDLKRANAESNNWDVKIKENGIQTGKFSVRL